MKSIIKEIDIETLSRKFTNFFACAEATARATKFVQRTSQMTGMKFLQMLVFGLMRNPQASLSQMVKESHRLGVNISNQGIDERINRYAVEFVKTMYEMAFEEFKNRQGLPMDILKQFTKLFLVDSTFKQLPKSMAEEFPGSGGKASKASLKVQLVFEFLCGHMAQLVIEAGKTADQAFTKYLGLVEAGALVIMDLGYFRLASLQDITQKSAYFIMRYHYLTSLWTPNGDRIDLPGWMQSHAKTLSDNPVLLGPAHKQQIACRLISTPVPLAVAEERRRKAISSARSRGKTLSDAYLYFLGWSFFVTNVPDSMLSPQQVLTFYRLRWQIELVFKLWKSYCGLEHIPAFRRERILTEFYAKLIVAILTTFIVAPLRSPDEALPKYEISPVQVRHTLADFARDISNALSHLPSLIAVFKDFFNLIARSGFKQIRRYKPNVYAMLAQLSTPTSIS